ncbi:MAG: ribosomal-processing cysteine protease Prp [Bacilli bacterium]|nr:ribosomal-processing cysteine protease Prp [Bacilli bacterium]
MIKVNISRDNNKIEIHGHSMYSDFGKDIVCAGVSSVVTTTINGILSFNKDFISYQSLKDKFIIEINNHNEIVDTLIKNMINMLEQIEEDYPKNVKIRKEN